MSCKFCFEFRSYSSAFLFFVLIMRCSRLFNIARLVFECTIHTHAATCVYSAQQIRTGKLHKWKESLSRRRRRLCHGCAVSISRNICKRRLALQRLIQLTAEPYECVRASESRLPDSALWVTMCVIVLCLSTMPSHCALWCRCLFIFAHFFLSLMQIKWYDSFAIRPNCRCDVVCRESSPPIYTPMRQGNVTICCVWYDDINGICAAQWLVARRCCCSFRVRPRKMTAR